MPVCLLNASLRFGLMPSPIQSSPSTAATAAAIQTKLSVAGMNEPSACVVYCRFWHLLLVSYCVHYLFSLARKDESPIFNVASRQAHLLARYEIRRKKSPGPPQVQAEKTIRRRFRKVIQPSNRLMNCTQSAVLELLHTYSYLLAANFLHTRLGNSDSGISTTSTTAP